MSSMNTDAPNSPKHPIVLVHGGAGFVPEELREGAVEGTRAAVELAQAALAKGDCVDAAVAAVRELERRPGYNAGTGACMNELGEFETDAGIMRSWDRAVGAVAAAPDLADAIVVARAVMEHSRHSVLAGEGVRRFAKAHGVGTFDRAAVYTDKAQRRFDDATAGKMSRDGRADTVGAVVLDAQGRLCAAGSTGGVLLKSVGRVGDTPLVGAGFYASEALGACVATGVGEAIMGRVFCYALLERYQQAVAAGRDRGTATLQALADEFCDRLRAETRAAVGTLAVAPDGAWAIAHACRHMSWGFGLGLESTSVHAGLARERSA